MKKIFFLLLLLTTLISCGRYKEVWDHNYIVLEVVIQRDHYRMRASDKRYHYLEFYSKTRYNVGDTIKLQKFSKE